MQAQKLRVVQPGLVVLLILLIAAVGSGQEELRPIIGEKWALVIGISDYQKEIDLKFADDDAQALYDLLLTQGGFSEDQMILLLNEQATKQAIFEALGYLLAEAQPKDLVLLYFSGLGCCTTDKDGDEADGCDEALWPHDVEGDREASWILDDEWVSWVQWLTAQVIVILDSCCTAGFDDLFLPLPRERRQERLLLASSQEDQAAWEKPDLAHGLFTYYLLEALEGKGDANGDGIVTAEEAFRYAKPKVETYVQERNLPLEQTPVMIDEIEGEVPLARY